MIHFRVSAGDSRARSYWASKMCVRFSIVFLSSSDDFSHDGIAKPEFKGKIELMTGRSSQATSSGNLQEVLSLARVSGLMEHPLPNIRISIFSIHYQRVEMEIFKINSSKSINSGKAVGSVGRNVFSKN